MTKNLITVFSVDAQFHFISPILPSITTFYTNISLIIFSLKLIIQHNVSFTKTYYKSLKKIMSTMDYFTFDSFNKSIETVEMVYAINAGNHSSEYRNT